MSKFFLYLCDHEQNKCFDYMMKAVFNIIAALHLIIIRLDLIG